MFTREQTGQLVRRLREEHMWSIEDLSEASGVDKNAISDLERGVRNTRNATIKKLATAFKVNPQYLIGVTTDPRIPGEAADQTTSQVTTSQVNGEDHAQKPAA